jgi:hypothetical protein
LDWSRFYIISKLLLKSCCFFIEQINRTIEKAEEDKKKEEVEKELKAKQEEAERQQKQKEESEQIKKEQPREAVSPGKLCEY